MLTPEARRAVIRKTVEIDEGRSIGLTYLPDEKREDNRSKRMLLPIAKDDKAEPQMPALPIPDPEKIDWSGGDWRKIYFTFYGLSSAGSASDISADSSFSVSIC